MTNIQRKISVQTYGNPSANSGVGAITIYNNPQFKLNDNTPSGFDENDYYFSVKIERSYTIYKLFKNNVRSYQSIRKGYLAIAFSIPRGYELEFATPLNVLLDLWRTFREQCMSLKSKISGVYEYNASIDKDVLNETAATFILKESKKPYREMNPNGPNALVVASVDKIEQLLADVHYNEFSGFSEILIAESCSSVTNYNLLNISIPRNEVFTIIGSDDKIIQKVSDKNYVIKILPDKDQRYFEIETLEFCIQDLIDGKTLHGVSFDHSEESVKVDYNELYKPKEIKVILKAVLENDTNNIQAADLFTLTGGPKGEIIAYNSNIDSSFTLEGEKIGWFTRQDIKLYFNNSYSDKYVTIGSPVFNNTNYEITVKIKEKEKTKVETVKPVFNNGGQCQPNNPDAAPSAAVTPQFKVVQVKLSFSKNKLEEICGDKRKSLNIKLVYDDGNVKKVLLQQSCVNFTLPNTYGYSKKLQNNNPEALLYFPEEFLKNYPYICFENKNYKYTIEKLGPTAGSNVCEKDDSDIKESKKRFYEKINRKAVLSVILIITLLLGGAVGFFIGYSFTPDNKEPKVAKVDSNDKEERSAGSGEAAKVNATLDATINKDLSNESLTYCKIINLYDAYVKVGDDTTNNLTDKTRETIRQYHSICTAINNDMPDEIKKLLDSDSCKINECHKAAVELLTDKEVLRACKSQLNNNFSIAKIKEIADSINTAKEKKAAVTDTDKKASDTGNTASSPTEQNTAKTTFPAKDKYGHYSCPICGVNMHGDDDEDWWFKHMRTEHGKYYCKQGCPDKNGSPIDFGNRDDLENHNNETHSKPDGKAAKNNVER